MPVCRQGLTSRRRRVVQAQECLPVQEIVPGLFTAVDTRKNAPGEKAVATSQGDLFLHAGTNAASLMMRANRRNRRAVYKTRRRADSSIKHSRSSTGQPDQPDQPPQTARPLVYHGSEKLQAISHTPPQENAISWKSRQKYQLVMGFHLDPSTPWTHGISDEKRGLRQEAWRRGKIDMM